MTNSARREHQLDFDGARQMAAAQHLPDYAAWRSALERRYSVMPPWYWNETTCRQNYASHIQSISDWQANQTQINAGIVAFHQKLGGSR
jgi:hypothetical protein